MSSGIEKFAARAEINGVLRAFDDRKLADPLFLFSLPYCGNGTGNEVDLLVLLNNWWCDREPVGTLPEGIEYTRICFEKEREREKDTTFRYLFEEGCWSRKVIVEGRALVANAVPGVWRNGSAVGALAREVYLAGFEEIWYRAIDKTRPKEIYLCGAWAKSLAKIVRARVRQIYGPGKPFKLEVLCHPSASLYKQKIWANRDALAEE
jgi:hypothetical protein